MENHPHLAYSNIIKNKYRKGPLMFNAGNMTIDFSDFELIPEAKRATSGCAINISPSGYITLNRYLLQEVKQRASSLQLGFAYHKQDKRILPLFPSDTPNYTFPPSGSKKDTAFSQSLVADGIPLPARYIATWNEEARAWVGVLAGDRVEDPLTCSLQTVRSGRGRKRK